ncbi:DNA cytosine methyltransferase [Psychrobacillus sp. FSL K6-1415]|uniref:DNA cytosine methyltransferase n=1 Tax=Psychrobacillus sp. FSL K6-1415 TaxID=2921544 RepID=UPI0030F7AE29
MNNYKYTSIDLFSGPGGLATGLKLAGFLPLIAVEINRETAETYCENHQSELFELDLYLQEANKFNDIFLPNNKPLMILGDVRKLSDSLIKKILKKRFLKESVDLVTGGPPCESYSIAGKRMVDDERDYLFIHISRIAKAVNSKMFLFENVKGVLSKKNKEGIDTFFSLVCEEFERNDLINFNSFRLASWHKDEILLNCVNYGVPQNRERVFLVAINNKYKDAFFNYPEKTHGEGKLPVITVGQAIRDLPLINSKEENFIYCNKNLEINSIAHDKYLKFVRGVEPKIPSGINYDGKYLDSHKASKHFDKTIKRMSFILPGESMKTAAERLINEGKNQVRDEYFPRKPYGARYRRLKENSPSFTVTSHCFDEMIHPSKDRALTPREVARLQTFPDWYVFKGPYVIFHSDPKQDRYEQIGDAVPPLVAFKLGEEIVNTLNEITQN